jgi:hypothetical protein
MNVLASQRPASALVVVVRVLLLLLAGGAVALAFLVVHRQTALEPATHAVVYLCAMHPEVRSSAPGDCPICRMALEPARDQAPADPSPGARNVGATPGIGSAASSDDAAGSDAQGAPRRFTVPPLAQDRVFADVMWVRERPIARDVVAAAWVESPGTIAANLYRDELALLEANEEGAFVRSGEDAPAIRVALGADRPTGWDAETARVRLRAPSGATPVGAVGWVRFASRTRKMLAVPQAAVLQGPSGAYVLVASVDRRTFTKRPIEIGRVLYGYAPVLSGLASGERIAVMETFFLDAERRLRAQSGRPATPGPP